MPGSRGPVPKRSTQRRNRTKPALPERKAVTGAEVFIPPADDGWHFAAAGWYGSLGESGQSVFYTSSDWWTAWAAADVLSRELSESGPVTASAMMGFYKA